MQNSNTLVLSFRFDPSQFQKLLVLSQPTGRVRAGGGNLLTRRVLG
jgi:hypothetical protein